MAKNERCPLQKECGKKCEYAGHELDCIYYASNAVPCGATIPDQEERRAELERKFDESLDEKALDELMADDGESAGIVYIPVDQLYPHPDNPRKSLGDEESLRELADSIKAKGVLQNLTVVERDEGGYTVIIGHRRTEAAKMAGLDKLPCAVVEMSAAEQYRTMVMENMQRRDLTMVEEARSFQTMIEFGDSVEEIAKQTGFSKKTITRRLEVAKLDKEKLDKATSERQISLADLDKLAEIEDVNKRDEMLEFIGTNNFEYKLQVAIMKQKVDRKMPFIEKRMKELGAKKMKSGDQWNGKYTQIGRGIVFIDTDSYSDIEPERLPKSGALYYLIEEGFGQISYYEEKEKAKNEKSPEQKQREADIAERHKECEQIKKTAYDTRKSFIEGIRPTKENKGALFIGALLSILNGGFFYSSLNRDMLYEKMEVPLSERYDQTKKAEMINKLVSDESLSPLVVYAGFGDSPSRGYSSTYKGDYPRYNEDHELNLLYTFLESLGYDLSDDERMMRDGTHPIFQHEGADNSAADDDEDDED